MVRKPIKGPLEKGPIAETASVQEGAGCYVYCLALCSEEMTLGDIGIEGQEVHSVVFQDLCALVHRGISQPYQAQDKQVAEAWVIAHHSVVDTAWKRWEAVLPVAFNTIIAPSPGQEDGEQNLRAWMKEEYHALKLKLQSLRRVAEFGIQAFWDLALVARRIAEASPEIRRLEEDILSMPRGHAYMHRQKLAHLLKQEMEARASEQFQALYERLRHCAIAVRVEKIREAGDERQMIINLSCLMAKEQHSELEPLIAEVRKLEGLSVRVVGPFPPYSFC